MYESKIGQYHGVYINKTHKYSIRNYATCVIMVTWFLFIVEYRLQFQSSVGMQFSVAYNMESFFYSSGDLVAYLKWLSNLIEPNFSH